MKHSRQLPHTLNTAMRYYEIFEKLTPVEKAQRETNRLRAASDKRANAQRKKTAAAFKYQDDVRAANATIQSANDTMAAIKPS
jgi:hypothetical protein